MKQTPIISGTISNDVAPANSPQEIKLGPGKKGKAKNSQSLPANTQTKEPKQKQSIQTPKSEPLSKLETVEKEDPEAGEDKFGLIDISKLNFEYDRYFLNWI